MTAAYYNENDSFCAAWLRNLIAAGHIAPGDVDERDIRDVQPSDLHGYTQCHFFAGIGIWSLALRRAGWPDDRLAWTGSCPCQPFSAAGRKGGFTDERHLWPAWYHLISVCRPAVIFGEQVASKDGLTWLDLVQADLESADYAVGAADMCAAGVGAPHWRQRLWFVAKRLGDTDDARLEGRRRVPERADQFAAGARGVAGELADASNERQHGLYPLLREVESGRNATEIPETSGNSKAGRVANAQLSACGCQAESTKDDRPEAYRSADRPCRHCGAYDRPGPVNGFWEDADWIVCRDGKWRPVEPGLGPLVDVAASRVGRLRAYGNAIVAEVATTFIESYCETRQGTYRHESE